MELFDGQQRGVSIRECARQLGVSDTAVRKATAAGRCAKLADGTVDVEAVRLGMSLTANPFRGGPRQAGVVGTLPLQSPVSSFTAEMAAEPAARAPAVPPMQPSAFHAAPSAPSAAQRTGAEQQTALLTARLTTEQTRAEREQIELAQLKGTVVELAPVMRAVVDAMVAARAEIMSLPDRLTPIVTPETDAGKIYAAIEAEVLRVCTAMQDKLSRLAARQETSE